MTYDKTDNSAPNLLIMAAGLGSRFGGVKQLAKVGPNGEALMDLSIKDALRSGFGDVILIIRSAIEADVREHMADQHPDLTPIYVRQDDLGPARAKPWGTVHAILSASEAITKPTCAINADDYYGPKTFDLAIKSFETIAPGRAASVAFQLDKTLPTHGAVTRGVCQVADGLLESIVEADKCERMPDGTISVDGKTVPPTTPVSMNLWCFGPDLLVEFQKQWEEFYAKNSEQEKAECLVPVVINELLEQRRIEITVASSPEEWVGLTNPEDFEAAKKKLDAMGLA